MKKIARFVGLLALCGAVFVAIQLPYNQIRKGQVAVSEFQPEVPAEGQTAAEEFVSPESLPEDVSVPTNATPPTLDASNGVKKVSFRVRPVLSLSSSANVPTNQQ